MKTTRLAICLGVVLILTSFNSFSASPLIISEFMASMSNTNIIADEDGESSDWIEIRNISTNAVNLEGWSLTDDAGNLRKWRFPATNILAGTHMVVFASGKDRRTPGRPLHTNFKLDAAGEYLALVEPDGRTIATEFSPRFPLQVPNVSYGFPNIVTQTNIIGSNSLVRVLVPLSSQNQTEWMKPEFPDSTWRLGTNGVGYETNIDDPNEAGYAALLLATAPSIYLRFSEPAGSTTVANMGSLGASGNGSVNGAVLGIEGPRSPQFPGFEQNNTAARFSSGYISVPGSIMNNRNAFTFAGWIRPTATQANRTGLWGQNDCVEFGFITSSELQIWTPGGGSLNVSYPFPLNEWHHVVVVGDGASLKIYLDGQLRGTGGSATSSYGSSSYNFNIGGGGVFDASGNQFVGDIDEVAVWFRALSESEVVQLFRNTSGGSIPFTPYIRTDVRPEMFGINSSIYLRYAFEIENPSTLDHLVLRMRYDDGFAVFLNGNEILTINALETNYWNSAATNRNPDSKAVQFEDFNISYALGFLKPGTNILAIQGLNIAKDNTDFLIEAELNGYSVVLASDQPSYFTQPTPGALNGVGSPVPGPLIADAKFSPEFPTDSDPITVTARIAPTFAPVESVKLNYRVMFGPIITVDMKDDGLNNDGEAGDGVYGAIIPAEASLPGQMVRWYITATDINQRQSRWPIFSNPTDSEEYMGTVIQDPSIQSHLNVLHLFVENVTASETRAGTRCSLYYLGEFYDNVFIHLRGQSSAGWTKKGFNLDFNRDHRFKYGTDGRRVKDIKLMSNWGDKSRMRNTLFYEMAAKAGCDGHFAFPIRVQRNGAFHAVLDLMEDSDDLMLERLGRDPNGAFYKMYNNLSSTGGAEKKTRRWEGTADLQSLITNLAPTVPLTNRILYAYDNIELPQTVSYFAMSAIASHQDHGHKNYYLYCDNDGTGEWAILPWDVDLTWGRTWTDSGGYFQDTLFQDNILNFYNLVQQPSKGSDTNRFYMVFFHTPDFRRMYLRRLRTLMDTLLQPPNTPTNQLIIESRILELMDLLDPPGITNSDAYLDYIKWGYWGENYTMRTEASRIINIHLPGRRAWLFTSTNATCEGDPIPPSQPPYPSLKICEVDYSPISGNQLEEYICITNPLSMDIDISGWRLEGAVRFTFKPGTVILANRTIYVSPNQKAFRSRAVAPKGRMGLFVVGPYQGQLSARGETLRLLTDRGYLIHEYTYEGNPSLAQKFLRITEIMYNPIILPGSQYDAQEFEFIELKNIGDQAIDLNGVRFVAGITFDFTGSAVTNLEPGQIVLVVKNRAAFEAKYGSGFNIAGEYSGYLDNAGERIRLVDARGEEILDFTYNDRWFGIDDGLGFSLVCVNENAEPDEWNNKSNWRVGSQINGTPGMIETVVPIIPPIIISEILANSDGTNVDFIELYNPTSTNVDISGWFLTDDFNLPFKFRIPDNTIIPPNGFVVFDETHFNANPYDPNSFGLSADGDEVYLFSATPSGILTGYFDGFKFGPTENNRSLGYQITSDNRKLYAPQVSLTPGTNNSGPLIGPIVISEIMYHPPDIGTNDNTLDEYIEIMNIGSEPVALYHPDYPTNTWHLRGGVDLKFPEGLTLMPGKFLLLVNFDPSNSTISNNFAAKYNLPSDIVVIGPYRGKLGNDNDDVELEKPITWRGTNIMYVQVDKVDYYDTPPWQKAADGFGYSLNRYPVNAFGNDPASWIATLPNPGGLPEVTGTPPVIVSQSESRVANPGKTVVLTAVITGSTPIRYKWYKDGVELHGETNSVLIIPNIQPENTGKYVLIAENAAGATMSQPIQLFVSLPPVIVRQPESVFVRVKPDPSAAPSTNATFYVGAVGSGKLYYQWRFNGVDIPGATNDTITITNVQMSDYGEFTVVVSDDSGSVISQPAWLYPLVRPSVTLNPVPLTVSVGSMVTLSAEFFGWPPPFTTEWRRVSVVLTTNVQYESNSFFTFQTTLTPSTNSYRFVVKNAAYPSGVASSLISIYTVADTDGDGMHDSWETAYGLLPDDPTDKFDDPDGDGMPNWAEYVAGTNPKDPASKLEIFSFIKTNTVSLRFNSISARTYTVEYSTNLGSGVWLKLLDFTAKTSNRVETVIDPDPSSGQRYYRVVTPRR